MAMLSLLNLNLFLTTETQFLLLEQPSLTLSLPQIPSSYKPVTCLWLSKVYDTPAEKLLV